MQTEQPDVDPQNIKPLSNEELTKLIVITNRMVGSLTSELSNLQRQLNELSNIILETKLTDATKLAEIAHVLEHGAPVETKQPIIDLPISPMTESTMALMGVSVRELGSTAVFNNKPEEIPSTDVDNLTSNTQES